MQGQSKTKSEQKPTAKKFLRFHNHSPSLKFLYILRDSKLLWKFYLYGIFIWTQYIKNETATKNASREPSSVYVTGWRPRHWRNQRIEPTTVKGYLLV